MMVAISGRASGQIEQLQTRVARRFQVDSENGLFALSQREPRQQDLWIGPCRGDSQAVALDHQLHLVKGCELPRAIRVEVLQNIVRRIERLDEAGLLILVCQKRL